MSIVRKIAMTAMAFAMTAAPAYATVFIVDAATHSSLGVSGTPLNTGIALTTGQNFTVSSSTNDLWSAGALPRFSDANGLTGSRLATALDDSGQAVGTQIGGNFGLPNFGGYAAPYGSLVGRIGGVYQLIGANYAGPAWNTGNLELFYWDSNAGDNSGRIAFDINSAVPEAATWMMLILGFGIVGGTLRRRSKYDVRFA
ncbi:MAG: PEPxxWA-CTERM sorting domain-containing protein [Chakrabartia sp.]